MYLIKIHYFFRMLLTFPQRKKSKDSYLNST
nr:MAG TPA: hypothetical protein [Bacteriophage sp.]